MNLKADKYFAILEAQIRSLGQYGIDLLLKLIRQPLKIVLLLILWKAIFLLTGSETIAGLNQAEFLTYMAIASVIGFSLHPWTVYEICDEQIKRGYLSGLLARPVKFMPYVFFKMLKEPLIDMLFPIPVVAVIFSTNLLGISFIIPSSVQFLLFLVSFLLAIYIGFLTYYVISITMFWTGDLWSIWGTIDAIQALLSGQIIPLTIAPVLNTLAGFLPFKYIVFIPAYIFVGKYTPTETLQVIGLQLAWIFGLSIAGRYIFKLGLRKFDAQGG